MTVGRKIIGVVAGILCAGVVIALVESVGHAIGRGAAVFGFAAGGYGLGAAVGTAVATVIAGARVAVAVPLVLAVLAAINLFAMPHPMWFVPAAVVALAAGWWAGRAIGGQFGAGR